MEASKFNLIKERARRLIQMDNNGVLDQIAENKRKNGTLMVDANGDVTYETPEKNNLNESYTETPLNYNSPAAANLPKEILESFKNNDIDTSILAPEASILDRMGITPQPAKKAVRKQINEEKQQNVNTTNANIDYSLIKVIVEDAVKKYMGAYSKKIINESAQKTVPVTNVVQLAESFNFVDTNGILYKAKLEKIGKLKK